MSKLNLFWNLEYEICFGIDIREKLQSFIENNYKYRKVIFITDETVSSLYSKFLEFNFLHQKKPYKYIIKAGEVSKSISEYYKIIRFLASINADRHDLIIAFGGGVVGDLSGFVASTYMRGIDYIQVPTTLLSMVDSSIGSKTAINTDDGENLIGTFYNPKAVFIDLNFLDTLPNKEFINGLAEVIKSAIIRDKELIDLLMSKNVYEKDILEIVIKKSISIKKEIVESDLRESGKRQLLNFGHTIGHAIEKLSDLSISHGYAVAIGMAMIVKAYYKLEVISEETYLQIIGILKKYQLPISCKYDEEQIYQVVLKDKKNNGNGINLIYPQKIGHAVINNVNKDDLKNIISVACK